MKQSIDGSASRQSHVFVDVVGSQTEDGLSTRMISVTTKVWVVSLGQRRDQKELIWWERAMSSASLQSVNTHREAFVFVVYCPVTPALGLDTVAGMHSGINFKTDKIPMAVFMISASSADARVEGAIELEGWKKGKGDD